MRVTVLSQTKQNWGIRVSGASEITCRFDYHGKPCCLSLTLNGDYTRTPSKTFSMIKDPEIVADSGCTSLSYQVLLSENPPRAEFQIFKFHDQASLTAAMCPKIHLSVEQFKILTETEPAAAVAAFDSVGQLPAAVARFLQQARKCTSS